MFGEPGIIFREQGSTDLQWGPRWGPTEHLHCNCLMIHNGIRNKIHMYKGYMSLKY